MIIYWYIYHYQYLKEIIYIYNNNNFIELDYDRYLFYGININIGNFIYSINSNNISNLNTFDTNNKNFVGIYGNNMNGYSLKENGELYYGNGVREIPVFTGLFKYYFNSDNNRYIVYINNMIYDIIEINYTYDEYTGYQGFYNPKVNNIMDIIELKNSIREVKSNREVINGDTLLTKSGNIYVVNENNYNNINFIEDLEDENNILFYDLNTLNIYDINMLDDNYVVYGFFDHHKFDFQGYYGDGSNINNYNHESNIYYKVNYNTGFITDIKYKYFLQYKNNLWYILFMSLYKFNYLTNDNLELLIYGNYKKIEYCGINKYDDINLISKYQGYYDKSNYIITYRNDFDILNIIQNYKENFINIRDCLLMSIGNIHIIGDNYQTVNIEEYESKYKCFINIEDNKIIILYNSIIDSTFFNVDLSDNKIKSKYVISNAVNDINFEINIDEYILKGSINNNQENYNNGDLNLNINDNIIEQYNGSDLCNLHINNKYVIYQDNNSDEIYSIITDINGNITLNEIMPSILSYNGYYSGILNEEEPNYYLILQSLKNGRNPKLGDYLLLNNNDYIKIFKYIDEQSDENDAFINIETVTKFLFYSNNGDSIFNSYNKILYIHNNNVEISNLNNFEHNNQLYGLAGKLNDIQNNVNNEGLFYLSYDSTQLKNILKISYNTGSKIEYITLFNCASKYYYNTNNLPTNDRYVINISLNNDNKVSIINFSLNEYIGYQGFYTENITNDTYKTVKNKIENIKLDRDVVIGDTLLTKYDNVYVIYKIIDNDIVSIDIDTQILYYDLGNLQVININENIINIEFDYFDQQEIFQGHVGQSEPESDDYKTDKYYFMYPTKLYRNISSDINNAIWIPTFMSLNKFNYNTLNNNIDLLLYYYNNNFICINNKDDYYYNSKYQGYFSSDEITYDDNFTSKLNILSTLQGKKGNYINIRDTLLINNNSYKLTKLESEINKIILLITSNTFSFFSFDNNNTSIISYLSDGNQITMTSLSPTNNKLIGKIGNSQPDDISGSEGDLYLNIINGGVNLYQFKESWIPLYTNNRYIKFANQDETQLFVIETSLQNNVTVRDLNSQQYNGYYISKIESNPNYYTLLNEAKLNILPKLGDYLLYKNDTNIIIVRYIDNEYNNNDGFTQIAKDSKFLFFSNNGLGASTDKILLVNGSDITI